MTWPIPIHYNKPMRANDIFTRTITQLFLALAAALAGASTLGPYITHWH